MSRARRVQLCSPNGNVLRSFHLDECEGAPHEFRGVLRSGLLEALQSSLPSGTVQYACPIASVKEDEQGEYLEHSGEI